MARRNYHHHERSRGLRGKLYALSVFKQKLENGKHYSFVHYIGWAIRYEWVVTSDIVENTKCVVDGSPDDLFSIH